MTDAAPLPFIDLLAQRRRLGERIDRAVMDAVNEGRWIMGPQVGAFEKELAAFGQAQHAVSCANGTDALILTLRALNIGPGDAVLIPSFTFAATAECVALVGAAPVFVDVLPDTFNMDARDLDAAIARTLQAGEVTPKAVIAVDLFGQPADYPAIAEVAERHGLILISDSAQGFGCTLHGRHPLHWAKATTTSFFPAKPLGAYGDGGAVLTNDPALAERLDSLRVHGKATARDLETAQFTHEAKYLNMRVGVNSRLDTIQAAILSVKLDVFPQELELRQAAADRYARLLPSDLTPPVLIDGGTSVWAQYTVLAEDRDGLAAQLKAAGVPTAVYYPVPLHQQPAYAPWAHLTGALPVTEDLAGRVLSLPMHADLDEKTQERVAGACVRRG